jgi:hypothetical protein
MILLYVLAVCSSFAIFVLFLVLSKTLNNIMNNLIKLQYLLQKELDYKKEQLAIGRLMEEQQTNKKRPDDPENAEHQAPPAQNGAAKK